MCIMIALILMWFEDLVVFHALSFVKQVVAVLFALFFGCFSITILCTIDVCQRQRGHTSQHRSMDQEDNQFSYSPSNPLRYNFCVQL